jgi:hypothetical protein
MYKLLSSPTSRLVAGLVVTLAAIAGFSRYSLRQIDGLRDVQSRLVDRNRRDSLQLLRIQNDLQQLALALRDMTTGDEPYPILAWKAQLDRVRADLEDAVRQERSWLPSCGVPRSSALFRGLAAAARHLARGDVRRAAAGGRAAKALVRDTLQPQQILLPQRWRACWQNHESQEQAARKVEAIYRGVERNTYRFIAAVVVMISLTSLYLIHSSRRVSSGWSWFAAQRSELSRKLISVQEGVCCPSRASCMTSSDRS